MTGASRIIVDKYHDYIQKNRNYSIHTVQSYITDIKQYLDYLEDSSISYIPDSKSLRKWVRSLMVNEISEKSIHRKVSAVKSFANYLFVSDEIDNENPSYWTASGGGCNSPSYALMLPFFLLFRKRRND